MPTPTYAITELPPIIPIDPPLNPPYSSRANDINVADKAAGFASDSNSPGGAAVWEGSSPHLLPAPRNVQSEAYALNDTGQAVGVIYSPLEHAFYYSGSGQIQDLSQVLGKPKSWASDINNAGVIVGTVGNGIDFSSFRPFIYDTKPSGSPLLLEPLPGTNGAFGCAINSAGDVAGVSAQDDFQYRVFLFDGKMRDLGIDGISVVTDTLVDMNDSGVITGSAPGSAFRIDSSADNPVPEYLPALPDQDQCGAYAINNSGIVVGQYWTVHFSYPFDRAFVSFPSSSKYAGSYDLNRPDVVTNLGDWALWRATGINEEGQIVGWGTHQNDPVLEWRAFRLTPLPSPDDLALDRLEGLLAVFVMMFGGFARGGGGLGITASGLVIPIPPHEPLTSIWKRLLPEWKRLSEPERDLLIGSVVRKLTMLTQDPTNRKLLEQTGRAVIASAIEKLKA